MKAKEVLKILGITRKTLVTYHKKGLIKIDAVINGRYVYNDESVYALVGKRSKKKNKTNAIYCRVSTQAQKTQLKDQISRCLSGASAKGIEVSHVFEDIKSGMNNDRKGLHDLLIKVYAGEIGLIVIENRDRLVRFGFDLLEKSFSFFGTKIVVLNDFQEKTYEQELTDDLISIIHYFSMKSYSHRRKLNKLRKTLETKEKD